MVLRPYLRLALLSVVLALMALACQAPQGGSESKSTGEPKHGGIMVIANRGDPPTNWDPMFTSGITLHHVSMAAYGEGGLVRKCRTDIYKLCANLAESWQTNDDFTQWTFKVRNGVQWQDGTPMKAEDIKFVMDLRFYGFKGGGKTRAAVSAPEAFGDLKQIEVLPGNTLKVTLGRKTPYFLTLLSSPTEFSVSHPRHLMQQRMEAGEVNLGPADVGWVGLGPYKVIKHDKGSIVELRRNEKYWEKDEQGRQLPYLDGIDFPILTAPEAIVAAFRTGRIDGTARGTGFGLLPQQREAITQSLGDKAWFLELAGYRWMLHFNTLKPGPYQDVRVRKAISLWMDRRAGIQAVVSGQGLMHSMLDSRSPYPNPGWESWPGYNKDTREKDKAEAKRLMAEAGYANGVKLVHLCRITWATICEWMQGDLAGLGLQWENILADDPTWLTLNRGTNVSWDTQQTIGGNQTDPEKLESGFTRASINSNASVKHEDQRIPDTFAKFNNATNQEQRIQIYREFEKYLLQEKYYSVSLFDEMLVMAYRSYVKGMLTPPEDINHGLDFAMVWLDK